jgi:hypothetical protein
MRSLLLFCFFLLSLHPSVAIHPSGEKNEKSPYFEAHLLNAPREHAQQLLDKFTYYETPVYLPADSLMIMLHNSYARAGLRNAAEYAYDTTRYRVSSIEVVFTKYPFNPAHWRTNYYDLLAWRLQQLFDLDAALNDPAIEWHMVLQTAPITAAQAKSMFHGLVLTLQPLPPAFSEEPPINPGRPPVENGGFLFRREINPDMYRSPLLFNPIPDGSKRPMDASRLKCPTW